MKSRRLSLLLGGGALLAASLTGCYKDLGNYDYHAINELQVDSLRQTYAVDVDDSLIIQPILKGTLYGDTARFTYAWEMGGQTVSTSHDLRMKINQVPGYKYSRYVVTDKENGVKSYFEFGVNVSSSTAGDLVMVLSKYQGRAELSYLRLDKPANWAVNYFKDRIGHSLGTTPQELAICYTESARNAPFVNRFGRVMVLVDNVVNLIDKSSLQPDSVNPVLTKEAYLQLVSYPKPDVPEYKSEFVREQVDLWRFVTYGQQMNNYFMEISAGKLFTATLAPSIWSSSYSYNGASPYEKGYFAPYGYWDDMSDTPDDKNKQAGYNTGSFIMYDQVNDRFAYANGYGDIYSIDEADVKAFPGYNLLWGAATNRPNNTSLAVLNNGNQCRLVLLQDGKGANNGKSTKKLVAEISGGSVMDAQTKFYMSKYNEGLYFSTGNTLYRYNILNITSGVTPSSRDKVISLTELGYDSEARITDICVSRSEKTLLVGVSRYGSDSEAAGDEPKGDILYFDLNIGTGELTYNAAKTAKGVAGIPVDVEIKYQTHYRNGVDVYGNVKDNI